MFKNTIKLWLQQIFGYDNYLFYFSIYTIGRLRNNKHEREFVYFMDMIPNEGVCLDIGANIGVMSVSLARKLTNAQVFSFEPIPNNLKGLKRIVAHYKLSNVRVFENALGAEAGELKMVLPVIDRLKMQGLSHVVRPDDESAWNKGEFYTVPVKRLDDMVELQSAHKITAIKIDVENFEYYVFQGAEGLLRKHKPIIYCELWANEMRDKTLNLLRGFGYEVKVFDGQGLVPYTDQDDVNFFLV
jgi:FkbM family methyltransferase